MAKYAEFFSQPFNYTWLLQKLAITCRNLEFAIAATLQLVKRVGGIEPPSLAWKAKVLPLNYTRIAFPK